MRLSPASRRLTLILLGAFTRSAPAQLAGTWRLDNSRSTGVGPNVGLVAIITASAETLFVERRFRLPPGPTVLLDTMIVNGAVLPYTFRSATGAEGRGTRSIRRGASASTLEMADSVLLDSPIGPAPRWTKQTWSIDAAGTTLTQEIELRQPFSTTPLKNVLIREKP
jgi:hypothetical protein